MIAKLCQTYGALPEAGGVLDQPLGLLLLGSRLLEFEQAYHAVREADRQKLAAPPGTLAMVARVQVLSLKERGD